MGEDVVDDDRGVTLSTWCRIETKAPTSTPANPINALLTCTQQGFRGRCRGSESVARK